MSSFKFDPSGLLEGLTVTEAKADAAIRMYAETGAQKLRTFAQEHRPWTDRTNQARLRLTGEARKQPNGWRLYLSHGVDYGIWLELAHEKRFSIIPRTIQQVGELQIMPGFKRLLERMGMLP